MVQFGLQHPDGRHRIRKRQRTATLKLLRANDQIDDERIIGAVAAAMERPFEKRGQIFGDGQEHAVRQERFHIDTEGVDAKHEDVQVGISPDLVRHEVMPLPPRLRRHRTPGATPAAPRKLHSPPPPSVPARLKKRNQNRRDSAVI